MKLGPGLFPDAEGRENQIQNVIGRGFSGERIEMAEGRVQVEQQHLVRDLLRKCPACSIKRCYRTRDSLVMTDASQHSVIADARAMDQSEDGGAEFFQTFSGDGGRVDELQVIRNL